MPSQTVGGKEIDANSEITATVTSREFVLDKPYEGNVIATTTVKGQTRRESFGSGTDTAELQHHRRKLFIR